MTQQPIEHLDQQEPYQVVVIGAGPGGYVAALAAAHLGLTVAVIEQAEVGGTCLNRGCIPTKTLLHTAELFDEMKEAATFGIKVDGTALDFDALRTRKESMCDTLRKGVEGLLDGNGIAVIRGHATIISQTQVKVECMGDDGAIGASIVTTENIVIATGTRPELPAIPGIDLPGVHTSDTILEDIPHVERLAVLGGGVIGVEFASIYASFGTEVSVLIASDRPLRALDRELGQSLSMELKKKGASIITRASVLRIEKTTADQTSFHDQASANGQESPHVQAGSHEQESSLTQAHPLRVVYSVKDEEQALEVDAVLVAKGRNGDIGSLLGEGLSLDCEGGRIIVDERMRTSIEGIYAIGDICTAGEELAHSASAEGMMAVSAIADVPCEKRLDLIPTCIYTSPEIACVGMTEAEAKEAGITVRTGKFPMAGNGKTLITNQGRSFMKIIADQEDRVIGAQLMCARATDIIAELAVGIAAGLTVSQMLEVARPHPTFEEAVGEALESITGTAIHALPKRR